MKKLSGSHFNDMNQRYDVQKSDLKAILMTQIEDTTYENAVWKSF